jgi:hypothetical protein
MSATTYHVRLPLRIELHYWVSADSQQAAIAAAWRRRLRCRRDDDYMTAVLTIVNGDVINAEVRG